MQLAGGGLQARGGIEVAANQNGAKQPLLLALAERPFRGVLELPANGVRTLLRAGA